MYSRKICYNLAPLAGSPAIAESSTWGDNSTEKGGRIDEEIINWIAICITLYIPE